MDVLRIRMVTCRGCNQKYTVTRFRDVSGWYGHHFCDKMKQLLELHPKMKKLWKETNF